MPRSRARSTAGYSLVELMVVVAVLGILATVGMVSYRKYAMKAHMSEASSMLGMIRMRQTSYRSEFSQYCDVSSASHSGTEGSIASSWPTSAPGRTAVDWYAGLPAEWTQLGIRPSGPVYYRYDTEAGNPGVAPNLFGSDLNYGTGGTGQDAWWAAHAYGDLDGDGVQSTFEVSSLYDGTHQFNEAF